MEKAFYRVIIEIVCKIIRDYIKCIDTSKWEKLTTERKTKPKGSVLCSRWKMVELMCVSRNRIGVAVEEDVYSPRLVEDDLLLDGFSTSSWFAGLPLVFGRMGKKVFGSRFARR